ncbi:hypothetical protein NL312_28395, partial [Klebsiella pneumoniae]|nr:hypothetical protein [Klebsiella pneumoniae]
LELLNQKVDPESAAPDNTSNSDATATGSSEAPPTDNKAASTTTTAASQVTSPSQTQVTQPASSPATQNQSNPVELEKAAYTVALDAYKQGGAKKAIAPMQNFIKNHPN